MMGTKTKPKPTLGIKRNDDTAVMRAFVAPAVAPGAYEGTVPAPRRRDTEGADAEQASPTLGKDAANEYAVGRTAEVPLHQIHENEWNARVFYKAEDVDDTALSMTGQGQLEDAKGYFDEDLGRVILIDGQKRARGARAAGLRTLRVKFLPTPSSPLDAYKKSREHNGHRSSESALDNAVRWRQLLDTESVASQGDLARELGLKESDVSMVLSINRIPQKVLLHMKERPAACAKSIAYLISTIFSTRGDKALSDDADALEALAIDIVDQIQSRELTRKQVENLIAARTSPAKHRQRAETRAIAYAGSKGEIKVFAAQGRLDFAIKGLSEAKVRELEDKLATMLDKKD